MSAHVKLLLSMGISTLLAAGTARAAELCVKCTGPDANYACVVGGVSNATLDTISKFYCITSLAKAGPHASCSIDRSATAPCPGTRKELSIPAFLNDAGGGDQPQNASAAGQNRPSTGTREADIPPPPAANAGAAPPQQLPPASEPPPKTVQEMMEKGVKSTGEGISETQKSAGDAAKSASTALEKAGSAVGGAAKNSWKCLSSFFSNC